MKKLLPLAAFLLLLAPAKAQDKTMEDELKATFVQFDSTMNLAVMMPLSAQFDMIAMKYTNQWVPQYYAAYAKVMLSYVEPDVARKDLLVDEAENYLANVIALGIENDERYILAALVANGRLAVDGENRWQKYGPIFDENLKKAKELNPDNPHYYYLKGAALFYTPKMFGGGPKKALPYFEKAKELFPKLDKNNILVPYWGEPINTYYLGEINKK